MKLSQKTRELKGLAKELAEGSWATAEKAFRQAWQNFETIHGRKPGDEEAEQLRQLFPMDTEIRWGIGPHGALPSGSFETESRLTNLSDYIGGIAVIRSGLSAV